MEVILLERIERLGQMGDVVKVKPGFARNYLLPQKKALRSTDENRTYFEKQRVQLEAANLKHREEAESVASKLEGKSFAGTSSDRPLMPRARHCAAQLWCTRSIPIHAASE